MKVKPSGKKCPFCNMSLVARLVVDLEEKLMKVKGPGKEIMFNRKVDHLGVLDLKVKNHRK